MMTQRVKSTIVYMLMVLNVVGIVVIIALLASVSLAVKEQTDTNEQIAKAQVCQSVQNQYVTIQAVRKIGLKLGLPVDDLVPPDTTGLGCDELSP